MKRITVGVDGSASAAAALQWAKEMAGVTGAELVAVSSISPHLSEMPSDPTGDLIAERERMVAERWLPDAGLDPGSVEVVVRDGDPRHVLVEVTEETGADLLVVGRAGAGGRPGFLHLGSVVEHIAHHAATPLAVVPRGWSGPTSRIMVGVDGSDESFGAVAWVGDVAKGLEARVLAVQIAEPFLEWTPASSPDNWRRDVEQDIERWTADLAASGVKVQAIAARDLQPADGLVGIASAYHVDLIVIGARGLGGFVGLRFGGVAMKVLHRSGVPLVLIPPQE